jgi:AmmeMemoRadiSam system protein B
MEQYPRLRSLEVFPLHQEGKTLICLRDPLHIAETLVVSPAAYFILCHLDGRHGLVDIQEAYQRKFGELILSHELQELLETVDTNFFLHNARFSERQKQLVEEFRRRATRPAAHAGTVYKADPQELEQELQGYFRTPDGPGPAREDAGNSAPRALVAPHIDFHRGGPWYAWIYRELMQSDGADLYVLLGTSHCGGSTPFILTEKDFETPWGLVETDREFVRRLQEGCSADLFADEYLHRGEHSLEFQVVFLKFVSRMQERRGGKSRPFKIVPILVSSFHRMVEKNTLPEKEPWVGDFLGRLRGQIERDARSVCLVAGVDLAHVGAQFGDEDTITPSFLNWVEAEDLRLIDRLVALDAPGFFHEVAKDKDRRRICGFAPLYSLIHLLDGSRGRVLRYRQAFTRETNSAVTFTSVVFE